MSNKRLEQVRAALDNENVCAFLRVIRAGESSQEEEAYRMMFGGGLFPAPPWRHPHRTISVKKLVSSAAGAYQFLSRTWDGLVLQYGFEDFSPSNQDAAAVALILGRKALDDVIAGRIEEAITKCAKEWASLPGSKYGQPTQMMDIALAVYAQYGGEPPDAGGSNVA